MSNHDKTYTPTPSKNANIQSAMERYHNVTYIQMDAFKKIHSAVMNGAQEIHQRQLSVFSQIMAQTTLTANDFSINSLAEKDFYLKNLKSFQKNYSDTMKNTKEISLLLKKTGEDTADIMKESVAKVCKN